MEKLCLGTVQLGMRYGINNGLNRQPTHAESMALLQYAYQSGIRTFDTAGAYGEAEEILGKFDLRKHPSKIISKLPPETKPIGVLPAIESCLRRLGIPQIDGYLFHREVDLQNPEMLSEIMAAKRGGLVRCIGASVSDYHASMDVVRNESIDYIQIPYNIFDQRLDKTEFFHIARENGIRIFARSLFLQGLLLMEEDAVPEHLSGIRPFVRELRSIVGRHGFAVKEAAFLFAYLHEGIDYIVFGVDTEGQLRENLKIIARRGEFSACMEDLRGKFEGLDARLITPRLW